MRACACGLRTSAACRRPGNLISSTKRPLPRSKRGSSTRATEAPKYRVPTWSPLRVALHLWCAPYDITHCMLLPHAERQLLWHRQRRPARGTRALQGRTPPPGKDQLTPRRKRAIKATANDMFHTTYETLGSVFDCRKEDTM